MCAQGVVMHCTGSDSIKVSTQLKTSENSWEHRKTPKIIWYHPENNWGPLIDNLVQFEEDFNSGTKKSVRWGPVGSGGVISDQTNSYRVSQKKVYYRISLRPLPAPLLRRAVLSSPLCAFSSFKAKGMTARRSSGVGRGWLAAWYPWWPEIL